MTDQELQDRWDAAFREYVEARVKLFFTPPPEVPPYECVVEGPAVPFVKDGGERGHG